MHARLSSTPKSCDARPLIQSYALVGIAAAYPSLIVQPSILSAQPQEDIIKIRPAAPKARAAASALASDWMRNRSASLRLLLHALPELDQRRQLVRTSTIIVD